MERQDDMGFEFGSSTALFGALVTFRMKRGSVKKMKPEERDKEEIRDARSTGP